MIKALVPLAEGSEEMEAVVTIDVLRRAGWKVTAAGLQPGAVTCSRGVRLEPDAAWDDVDPGSFDVLAIPGGGRGVANLRRDTRVLGAVRGFHARGAWLAAICAGPLVLQDAGVLQGRRATAHPDIVPQLTAARVEDRDVVVDGRIITSRGAGTAAAFALAIVREVGGAAAAAEVARGMALAAGAA